MTSVGSVIEEEEEEEEEGRGTLKGPLSKKQSFDGQYCWLREASLISKRQSSNRCMAQYSMKSGGNKFTLLFLKSNTNANASNDGHHCRE